MLNDGREIVDPPARHSQSSWKDFFHTAVIMIANLLNPIVLFPRYCQDTQNGVYFDSGATLFHFDFFSSCRWITEATLRLSDFPGLDAFVF